MLISCEKIDDIKELKDKIKHKVPGAHNIQTYLTYLIKGPHALCMFDDNALKITVMAERMRQLKRGGT